MVVNNVLRSLVAKAGPTDVLSRRVVWWGSDMQQIRSNSIAAEASWSGRADAESNGRPKPLDHFKRSFDVTTSLLMLLALLPLVAIVVVLLAAQGFPILIRHKRVGRGGKTFSCLKFRTMVVNADAVLQQHLQQDASARQEWEACRKLKDDPRVTALGKALRKSSVDELPQLINILRGDMSLVGPRPIVPAEIVHYGPHIERYNEVRPGLTGAWQVSGRSDVSYPRRVALDCEYVASRSLGGDIRILLKTLPAVLTSRGSY